MAKGKVIDVKSQDLGLNKKLKNIKFDQAFDKATLAKADKVMENSRDDFLKATLEDFAELKKGFEKLAETSDISLTDILQNKAFSVKSRAATGGFPLASDVAKSLFEFCERVDQAKISVIKIHIAALEEIFSGKFDIKDQAKAAKLLDGLKQLAEKNAK